MNTIDGMQNEMFFYDHYKMFENNHDFLKFLFMNKFINLQFFTVCFIISV